MSQDPSHSAAKAAQHGHRIPEVLQHRPLPLFGDAGNCLPSKPKAGLWTGCAALGSALGSCLCSPAGKRLPVFRAAWSSRLSRLPFAPSCLRSPPPAVCPFPLSPGVCAVPAVPSSPLERIHWGYFLSLPAESPVILANGLDPLFLQCWQGGWHFPRYKGQAGGKWGEGERSCKTSPAVGCFFRHPPGCQHR